MLEMHKGGGAGTMAGPENDRVGVPDGNHKHYRRQGTVVGTRAEAAQGGAGGRGGPGRRGGWVAGGAGKEGPCQDRPPLCPFRLLPLLIYSGSVIALLKFQRVQSPKI